MRKIAVYDNFTEPKHRQQIDGTAARYGFTVDYYPAPQSVPAERRGEYEVIYGMPKPGELKGFTGLKWFCGSFAGVDAYLDESLYPSPAVMLSNSSGAYGVTIAEHIVMVTLMLLRHAPVYCAEQAALIDALNGGRLAGAALDVFAQEPIPAGDPAWTAKNLLITPHISGQMSLGYTRDRNVELFCEDLERYGRGEKPLRLVDRKIGY